MLSESDPTARPIRSRCCGYDRSVEIIAQAASSSAIPVLAALLGAAASTTISHFLTKRRDAAADIRQESRDRRTAINHARELDEQRREATAEREERERVAAVKSYYTAFTDALHTEPFASDQQLKQVELATEAFAMEILLLNHKASRLAPHLIGPARRLSQHIPSTPFSGDAGMAAAVSLLRSNQALIFGRLMEWAAHDRADKIQRAINSLAEQADEELQRTK